MAVRLQVDDGGATCAECSPTDTAEMLTWPGGEADTSLKTRRISFCIYFLAAAANTHPGFSLFPAGYLTTEIPA
jgi:hypothetical protein